MKNPFERDDVSYLVLMNDEGQYSIWPSFVRVPEGWSTVCQAGTRQVAVEYVETHWTDLRPRSLVAKSGG